MNKIVNWLKGFIGKKDPEPVPDKSIMERLEGLIPPVKVIQESYKVDRRIAIVGHEAMMATEKLIAEIARSQRRDIEFQELLLDQQTITGDMIDLQTYKAADAETIISNLREWLLGDDITIGWMLENVLIPSFAIAFAEQTERRQRALFSGLRTAVNALKRLDGVLAETE